MAIASRLKWYLDVHGLEYEILSHSHTTTSHDSACAAHVPEEQVAKSVLLGDEWGYVMAILPASRRVVFDSLQTQLGRTLHLASEKELAEVFFDCELGAVPSLGDAYGIPTLIDDALLEASDIYLEAGDHEALVRLRGTDFAALAASWQHGPISQLGGRDRPS